MPKEKKSVPCLVNSKEFSPFIIEIEQWRDNNVVPPRARSGLKRNMMDQWIGQGEAYATENNGLCFSVSGLTQGIINYYHHAGLDWTQVKAEKLNSLLASKIFQPNQGAFLQIHNLGDHSEVAIAMKRVTAKKKSMLPMRKEVSEKFNRRYNPMKSVNELELLRNGIPDLLMPIADLLTGYVIGIDIEWLESNPDNILEIGLSHIVDGKLTTEHFIVAENESLINGKYVQNNKNLFMFGDSQVVSLHDASQRVYAALDKADAVFGHAPYNDFKIMKMPEDKINNIKVLDTRLLHKKIMLAVTGTVNNKDALSAIAPLYLGQSVEDTPFHNAGNDIEVTGRILLKQASLDWVESVYIELPDYDAQYKTKSVEVAQENIAYGSIAFNAHLKANGLSDCHSIHEMILQSPLGVMRALTFAKKIHGALSKDDIKSIHFGLPEWRDVGAIDYIEREISKSAINKVEAILTGSQLLGSDPISKDWIEIGLSSEWGKKSLSKEDRDKLIDLVYRLDEAEVLPSL